MQESGADIRSAIPVPAQPPTTDRTAINASANICILQIPFLLQSSSVPFIPMDESRGFAGRFGKKSAKPLIYTSFALRVTRKRGRGLATR